MSKKTVEQPDFLAEIQDLQKQIDSLKKRLQLVEDNREKVRQKIYEKVKSDYEASLENLYNQLQPYQEKMQQEISALEEQILNYRDNENHKQEELEEYQLRFFAGEFDEDAFQPMQTDLLSEIKKIQEEISEREKTIANFREHLAFITGEPIQIPEDQPELFEENVVSPMPEKEVFFDDSSEITEEEEEDIEQTDFSDSLKNEEEKPFLKDTYGGISFSEEISQQDMSASDDEDYIWTSIPVLDVVDGDFSGESYTIDKERMTMGRGPNNDIQFATDTSVSRHHAQIVLENQKYYLVDLESSNGSSVNGIRVSRVALRPNDEITIGVSKMIIRTQE
ncbi:MAG: FHA domain-containing protein [bacterium]